MSKSKIKHRLRSDIQKARYNLTKDEVVIIQDDDFGDGQDFETSLNRDDIIAVNKEFKRKFQSLLNRADKGFKKRYPNLNIDTVELTGEATKIPFVKQVIKTVKLFQNFNRSLKSDNAAAIGCALRASRFNGTGDVQYQIQEFNDRPISIMAKIQLFLTSSQQTSELFDRGSLISNKRTIEFDLAPGKWTIFLKDGDDFDDGLAKY